METHREIIDRLGGIREVARMLGHANHTTVQGWHERNSIPVNRWAEVIQAADAHDKRLSAGALMPAELRNAAA